MTEAQKELFDLSVTVTNRFALLQESTEHKFQELSKVQGDLPMTQFNNRAAVIHKENGEKEALYFVHQLISKRIKELEGEFYGPEDED